MNFKLIIKVLISIPKSLYVCIHFWPIKDAIKLPILVSYDTVLNKLDGEIVLEKISLGIVKIGFTGSFGLGGRSYIDIRGRISFNGKASFARGTQIIVGDNANLYFGENFRCNSNCIINAGKNITFGDDNLLAWNVTVLDGDGHSIINSETNSMTNSNREIITGNHVWLCPDVSLLKGCRLPNNCVVATKSVITRKISVENSLVGNGNNILKTNINWIE